MRIKLASAPPTDAIVAIQFDGKPLSALAGETIAATLHAHGIGAFRTTRNNHTRGLYCGMGACFDCVVTVDGRPGVRACMEKVREGQVIRPDMPLGNEADPLSPLCALPTGIEPPVTSVDVMVVGAGPAGLSAAVAAAISGASVVVLDERPQSGGQYFKPLAPSHVTERPTDRQFAEGLELTQRARDLGVRIIQDATVWGADTPHEVIAMVDGAETIFKPRQLILATGAYERPVPLDNWTLPGVMTTGAAQTLVRAYKVTPGQRVVIAGNGPLNLQLAVEMVRAGVQVEAVLEAACAPSIARWSTLLRAWRFSPDLMAQGLRYLAELRAHGVRVQWGHTVVRVDGDDRLRRVTFAPTNAHGEPDLERARHVDADNLCLGYGFIPSTELARALGCAHEFVDLHLGYLQTTTTSDGLTSVPGVFAIGDGSALGGARVAMARGTLAGAAAAAALKKEVDIRAVHVARSALARALSFQGALWEIFKAAPCRVQNLPDSTIACRCEEITLGELRTAIGQGFDSLGSLKRMTRLGMGRCQGRYCACTAAKLLNEITGRVREPEQLFAPRLPAKPVPAACMAFEKPEWGGHKRSITPNLARPVETAMLPAQAADVVVIGAGVMGACLAYYLAQEGKDVLVVERDEANLQASGANAGSLHVQLLSFDFGSKAEAGGGPAAQTLPLGPASVALWRQLEQASGADFEISTTGGLMVADSRAALDFLIAKAAIERKMGIDNHIIGAHELRELAPALSHDLLGAEYAPQEGKINPLKATYGVIAAAQALGARFIRGSSVQQIDKAGAGWQIATSRCKITAGTIINAAGPWSREVAAMVRMDLPVHSAPLQMIVTETAPVLVKQLVAHADRHLSLKQATTGGLIIGGGWTASYDDKRRFNTTLRESVEGNLWVAQHVLPQLRGLRVLRTWAAMNINIDGAPILGGAAQLPGFYNAVTSNGYTLSPIVARMTVDIMMGRSPFFDPAPFSISRF
jgi:glycine/D-amino acid oxidase-like deaminating enzyme/bacterioferritin-associated ferredoxin